MLTRSYNPDRIDILIQPNQVLEAYAENLTISLFCSKQELVLLVLAFIVKGFICLLVFCLNASFYGTLSTLSATILVGFIFCYLKLQTHMNSINNFSDLTPHLF